MKKFWKWKNQTVTNQETQEQTLERTLFLNGTIAEESWFDDDITPSSFEMSCLQETETSPFGLTLREATAWLQLRFTT